MFILSIYYFSLTKILTAWQNWKWNLFHCSDKQLSKYKLSKPPYIFTYYIYAYFINEEQDWWSTRVEINPVLPLHIYILYIFYLSHNKRELRATEFTRTMKLLQLKDIFYIIQLRGDVRVHLLWTRDSVQSRMMYPIS